MTKKLLLSLIFIILVCVPNNAIGGGEWAEAPAKLTVREFLDMHFSKAMGRGDSEALNSFNFVSFYPSNDPINALVFIIQTWRDSKIAERNLRREIRILGDALYENFKARISHTTVKKRWKIEVPKENFIVKHVRYTDLKEVLAVTVDGVTYFDKHAIGRAASMVKLRGGVWSF